MGDIFVETKEVEEIKRTHDHRVNARELREKMKTEHLGVNTSKILATLKEDPNQHPFQFLTESIKDENSMQNLIWLQDLGSYVSAHILQRDGQELGSMDLVTKTSEQLTHMDEIITEQTYENLKGFILDLDIVSADVDTKLEGAI